MDKKTILDVAPKANRDIDWAFIESVYPEWAAMEKAPQDRFYHAEGNVWVHTKMVCEELVNNARYQAMDTAGQTRLFLSALMHDIGKPATTVIYGDNRVSSKGHSRRGETDARIKLWRAGYEFEQREAVCRMIRYHQEPFLAVNRENVNFLVHKWSHEVRLDDLALLAESDARGRRTDPAEDWQKTIDNVELFRLIAQDQGCFEQPKAMADEHTAIAYFRREGSISCDFPFYQDRGSDVIVLAGLPASGKDSWIEENCPGLPVISFDDAREDLELAHGENDGKAVHHAIDKAKELLRKKEPFVWNATHLSPLMRQKTLDLLYAYDARVRLVYLEQPQAVLLRRNNKRDSTLPNKTLLGMLYRWEVPVPTEADKVDYQVTVAAE